MTTAKPDPNASQAPTDPAIGQIETARIQAGLSQRALATQAGISVSGYRALVTGDRRSPTAATLRALARPLGLKLTLEPTTESDR